VAQTEANSRRAIPAEECEALVALYNATSGTSWKDHSGWTGSIGTECEWHGVVCGHGNGSGLNVTAIELSENNLVGTVPDALGHLDSLEWLSLLGNHLSGLVPKPLIQRWLSGPLWIAAEAPLLTEVAEIDFESAPSALLCGRIRFVLRADGSVTYYRKRCRNASRRDRITFCEVKQSKIVPQEFAKQAWFLEKIGFYALQKEYTRDISDAQFDSLRVTRDGKGSEVVDYADGGPLELWAVKRAILSVVADAEWPKMTRQATCSMWKDGPLR